MPMPRAIIFDWDNTLVDSFACIHAAFNETLAAMDRPTWTLQETRQRARHSLRDHFPILFGTDWEAARDIYYAAFQRIHLERLQPMPGAQALLEELAGRAGLILGVVSNKTGHYLRAEARHLGWDRLFHRLVGAADAPRDKPAADPVFMALEGSGVGQGAPVWFVGDADVDLQCGHAAGCVPVLVRDTPPQDAEFAEFPPQFYVKDLAALGALVKRQDGAI